MRKYSTLSSFILLLLLSTTALKAQTIWKANTYSVTFKIKNAGFNVDGKLSNLNASLLFSPKDLEHSKLKGVVSVNTINTGIEKRDNHLKSDDYFDEAKYPLIEMTSKQITQKGDAYEGVFDCTIKGVTRSVTMPFTVDINGNTAVFKGGFTIDRKDFKVGGSSITMSDDVKVSIEINASKD